MSNEAWTDVIEGMDVTDYVEAQVLPAGVEITGVIESMTLNKEAMILNFKIKALTAPSNVDLTKPTKSVDYSLFLPGKPGDDTDKTNNKKGMLKKAKEAFRIPPGANLSPEQFIGRTLTFTTKERDQKPDALAKYGKQIEVDALIKVD